MELVNQVSLDHAMHLYHQSALAAYVKEKTELTDTLLK